MKKDTIVIKKRTFITVAFLAIIILIATITISVVTFNKSNNKTANANLKDNEVIEYLESLGYEYEKKMYSNLTSTTYISITDKAGNIRIQKIINDYIGTSYTFQNSAYNDSHADILNIDENDEDEKIQYSAYNKWLNEVNLTDTQIIESINFYDENNSVKVIDIRD